MTVIGKGLVLLMKKLIGLIIAVVVVCAGVPLLAFGSMMSGASAGCTLAAAPAGAVSNGFQRPSTDDWDAEQIAAVTTIITVGRGKGIPAWGWVVAVATALQESGLHNLPGGDRDSMGLFQQRPSQGWGNPQQLADPAYQAGMFFDALVRVDGWRGMPLTQAAQAVQRSAFPDAYAAWTTDAIFLVSRVAGGLGISDMTIDPCVSVSAQGWTQPVRGQVVSGFRSADRPTHQGTDVGAARGAVISAAASGVVVHARCNVDPVSWGCDRDGTPYIRGCGWYVDIAHPQEVITRYCHMAAQPWVKAGDPVVVGQPIGTVGSSGNSSGPHLHFEVHVRGDATSAGAVDPEMWMRDHGAPLGP